MGGRTPTGHAGLQAVLGETLSGQAGVVPGPGRSGETPRPDQGAQLPGHGGRSAGPQRGDPRPSALRGRPRGRAGRGAPPPRASRPPRARCPRAPPPRCALRSAPLPRSGWAPRPSPAPAPPPPPSARAAAGSSAGSRRPWARRLRGPPCRGRRGWDGRSPPGKCLPGASSPRGRRGAPPAAPPSRSPSGTAAGLETAGLILKSIILVIFTKGRHRRPPPSPAAPSCGRQPARPRSPGVVRGTGPRPRPEGGREGAAGRTRRRGALGVPGVVAGRRPPRWLPLMVSVQKALK